MSFGQLIAHARKRAHLSLRELAAQIRKEDGVALSPQYLNDIEHDRRHPPADYLLQQFATVLQIPLDLLYFRAGQLPPDVQESQVSDEQILAAYQALRTALHLQS